MLANSQTQSSVSKPARRSPVRTRLAALLPWIIVLAALVGVAAWRRSAGATPAISARDQALASALKLAAGTVNLEGTPQAVTSESAADLLPLWQLLDELSTSSSSASEEITAVVEEIQLTMTSDQVKAINAMSIGQNELSPASDASSSTPASSVSGDSGAASAGAGPIMGGALGGGMPAGGPPPDGGGMPQGGASRQTGSVAASSSASSGSSAFSQVIQLLQSKLQS